MMFALIHDRPSQASKALQVFFLIWKGSKPTKFGKFLTFILRSGTNLCHCLQLPSSYSIRFIASFMDKIQWVVKDILYQDSFQGEIIKSLFIQVCKGSKICTLIEVIILWYTASKLFPVSFYWSQYWRLDFQEEEPTWLRTPKCI